MRELFVVWAEEKVNLNVGPSRADHLLGGREQECCPELELHGVLLLHNWKGGCEGEGSAPQLSSGFWFS